MNDLKILAINTALEEFKPFSTNQYNQISLPPLTSPKKLNTTTERDLNDILVKVQNDIQDIKKNVLSQLSAGESIDPEKIKVLFEQAEQEIESKKHEIVTKFNTKASTASNLIKENNNDKRSTAVDEKPINKRQNKSASRVHNPTPGQKTIALQKLKSIINPARSDARGLLNTHYGIPLPTDRKCLQSNGGTKTTPVTGTTVAYNSPAPRANQINGRLTPPPPTSEDKRKGLRNLIERKLIPASSHLSISPTPVKQKQLVLHQPIDMKKYKQDLAMTTTQYNVAHVKFDETPFKVMRVSSKRSGHSFVPSTQNQESSLAILPSAATSENPGPLLLYHTSTNTEISKKSGIIPLPSEMKECHHHKFIIQNGFVRSNSQDFVLFKQYYCLSWGSIMSLLHRLERLMVDYSIPVAFIDGDRLADLALFFEVGPKPTIKDLLLCVINKGEVENFIVIPGRRYMAPDGAERAAIKIQSMWRCYDKHSSYLEYRRKKWAAGIIALTWIMKCKLTMIRTEMRRNKINCLKNTRARAKIFQENWKKIKTSKRVIVHIPSLGYSTTVRNKINHIGLAENSQIGRMCDIQDPNVEVIYISPVRLSDDIIHYYHKLIEIMAGVCGVDPEDMKSRLKFITPHHFDQFPAHNLCLSSLLKYSTQSVRRLKNMLKGKTAYIVPGMMHDDDLFLAEHFKVPVLGSEPEVAQLYSMKSGVCRIFESAGVNTPPHEFDVYSLDQIYESLARLVTENLNITRWLFKIDNQIDGRGTAYCDVTPFLSSYESAIREQERYGEKWKTKWAYETRYNVILQEIPVILEKHSIPVDKQAYPTWTKFLLDFCRQGGIIEGCPPSESITGLTANVLIEPDGVVTILTIADQIHSTSPYRCWGYTLPQSSIEINVLRKSIISISEACKSRGIIGYMSIDFVTFIDPELDAQQLWAVGLNLSYSSSYGIAKLMSSLTNSFYEHETNSLKVTVNRQTQSNVAYHSKRKKTKTTQEKVAETLPRFCVYTPHLHHTNLNNIHPSVFFQICKAHGIGYDDQMKIGTSFTLLDSIRKEKMGMITIGESLYDAIWNFTSNLRIIHCDISSPTMQGKSDFHGAIEDLKTILSSLETNNDIDQRLYPTLDPMRRIGSSSSTSLLENAKTNRLYGSGVKYTTINTPEEMRIKEEEPSTCSNSPVLTINSSNGINCIDNRFPSSPISDNGEGI